MLGDWLTADESAIVLGCHVRHAQLAAQRENWRYREEPVRGGRRKRYARQDVLAYARSKGLTVPDLGTSDPTPDTAVAPVERDRGAAGAGVDQDAADEKRSALLLMTGKAREEAAKRLLVITQWQMFQAGELGNADDFVRHWNQHNPGARRPLTRATLYRWVGEYATDGEAGLVPGWYTREQSGLRIDPDLEAEFLEKWLDQAKPTVKFCYDHVAHFARMRGLEIPSVKSFHRLVERMPKSTVSYYRDGPKKWHFKWGPFVRRDWSGVAPNHTWFADHHVFDFVCRGPDGKPMRPWLTAFQDGRSRLIVGWYIGGDPNSDSLFRAARAGMLKYGIPEHFYLDNGKDMRVLDLSGGYRLVKTCVLDEVTTQATTVHLGIKTVFAMPHNPPAKLVERTFRIVNERFSRRWPSYVGGRPQDKPERLAEVMRHPEWWPTMDQVREAFDLWVEGEYSRMPCEGSGAGGQRRIDIFMNTPHVTRWASPEDLSLLVRRVKVLKVGRLGVAWERGIDYHHEDLARLKGEQIVARMDPDDSGHIDVYTIDGKHICRAVNQPLAAAGGTADTIRAVRKMENNEVRAIRAGTRAAEQRWDEPDKVRRFMNNERERIETEGPSPTAPAHPVLRPLAFEGVARQVVNGGVLDESTPDDRETMAKRALTLMGRVLELRRTQPQHGVEP